MPASTSPTCPVCPGNGTLLGSFGRVHWFRCRACGMNFQLLSRRSSESNSQNHNQGVNHG